MHAGFYLSPHTLSIGLIGPGSVGSALLEQLAAQVGAAARATSALDLRVRGIMTSKRMLLADARDRRSTRWRERARRAARPPTSIAFVDARQRRTTCRTP